MSSLVPEQIKSSFIGLVKRASAQNHTKRLQDIEDNVLSMPPTRSLIISLQSRYLTLKRVFVFTSVALVGALLIQSISIFSLLRLSREHETIVGIPGLAEVVRLRPGSFPDESVYEFAENVADYIGNFNVGNVDVHYSHVERYMSPLLSQQFQNEWRPQLEDWRQRKVAQTFSYSRATSFDLKKDAHHTSHYTVDIHGSVTQYVDGGIFKQPQDKVLRLVFQTKALSAEKPWLFELTSFSWYSSEQYRALTSESSADKKKK